MSQFFDWLFTRLLPFRVHVSLLDTELTIRFRRIPPKKPAVGKEEKLR